MRWFRDLTALLAMATASCHRPDPKDGSSGDSGTVLADADADSDADADADADSDTDVDTSSDRDTGTEPAGPEPTVLSAVSAAGALGGGQFSVALTVGVPVSEHQLHTTQHTISLGVGLAVAP